MKRLKQELHYLYLLLY